VLAGVLDAQTANQAVLAPENVGRMSTFFGYYMLQARARAGDYRGCLETIRRYWGGMLDAGATSFWEDFDLAWLKDAGRIDELTPPGKKDLHADFGDFCYKGLRHSLCHGWAAGPTAWLHEHVLGLRPLLPAPQAPGARPRLLVSPHLGDLELARGTFPTPAGIVEVRHARCASGQVETEISAPEGVEIVRAE
jgi:hypothetical protein